MPMSKGSKTKIPDFYECDITAHDLYKYFNTQFLGKQRISMYTRQNIIRQHMMVKEQGNMSDSLQKNVKLGYHKK